MLVPGVLRWLLAIGLVSALRTGKVVRRSAEPWLFAQRFCFRGGNAAAGGESDPLTILRLFSNPDGGPGDFAAEPPPSPPPGTAKSTAKPHGAESRTSLQSADTHKRSHRGGNVFAELTATNVTALDGDFAPQLPGGAFIDTYDLLQDAVADSLNGRATRESTLASILKSMQKAGGSS